MIYALLAHLLLRGKHHRTVIIAGWHWRYCSHRSHRMRRRCWRWFQWDGYCWKHNRSCFGHCSTNDKEGTSQ